MPARTLRLLLALLAAGAATWWAASSFFQDGLRLPAEITLEHTVANLSGTFDPAAVTEQADDAPVHVGGIQPSPYLAADGAYRRAIVAPPPSRLRFRVRAPAGAVLSFGAGIEGTYDRDPGAAGIRFEALVDGRRVYSRDVNPGTSRHHRRWFDERLPLGNAETRDVEITLTTTVAEEGTHLAGTAGWSHVRVVREERRERQPSRPGAPNVLVLLVDTLRADRLGIYGADPSLSPELDRFATTGLVFEHAIAQSSWTMPSVASIMTGLFPWSHGVLGEARGWGDADADPDEAAQGDRAFLSDALPTLAEQAGVAGITTVGISTNPIVSRGTNLGQGFETFLEPTGEATKTRWALARDVNASFVDWLDQNPGRRFLGYLHYMDVHGPYDPPEPFRPPAPPGMRKRVTSGDLAQLANKINRGDAPMLAPDELRYLQALYDGSIRYWDAELATLLDGLAARGLLAETLVVITSDHGEQFAEHGKLRHGMHLYDELLRVPLVVVGPGIRAGRVPEQAQSVDLFPTLAAVLDVATPRGLPGQNLLARVEARPAFSETRWGILPDGRTDEILSVRTSRWKLIRATAIEHTEVYDLGDDPGEQRDVAGRAPAHGSLAVILAQALEASPPPPAADGRDPRLAEKLRALGYVE